MVVKFLCGFLWRGFLRGMEWVLLEGVLVGWGCCFWGNDESSPYASFGNGDPISQCNDAFAGRAQGNLMFF